MLAQVGKYSTQLIHAHYLAARDDRVSNGCVMEDKEYAIWDGSNYHTVYTTSVLYVNKSCLIYT